jgi:hypothetical protein
VSASDSPEVTSVAHHRDSGSVSFFDLT